LTCKELLSESRVVDIDRLIARRPRKGISRVFTNRDRKGMSESRNLSGRKRAVGGLIKLFVVSSFGESCREQRLPREQQCGAIIPLRFGGEGRIIRPRRKEEGLKRTPLSLSLSFLFLPLRREFECSNEGVPARGRIRQGENERGSSHPTPPPPSSPPPPSYPVCCLCRGRPPGPIARN